jgi:CrcB protein
MSGGLFERALHARLRRRPPSRLLLLGGIFVGGACGALLRAGLAHVAPTRPGHWPWITFAVNVGGSFLLGFFATRLQERLPTSSYRRPLLGTGFCGALTTFSTFQIETIKLARSGDPVLAASYVTVSTAVGLCAVFAATQLVRRARVR